MPINKKIILKFFFLFFIIYICGYSTFGFRIKDIAALRGDRTNLLIGFSVIIGLHGTGDSGESLLARKPLVNAIKEMGIDISTEDIKGRVVAAVAVTATLPAFGKQGQKIDVVVSTLGDAISLRGGVLVMTPLLGPDKKTYALAQGLISDIPQGIELPQHLEAIGSTKLKINPKSTVSPTVGRVIGGALIEKEIEIDLNTRSRIYMNLFEPDFTSSFRIAKAINRHFGDNIAKANDAGTVEISIPYSYLGNTVELISKVENLEVEPDNAARVVIDERTGTVVISSGVRVLPVAISHGNIKISIDEMGYTDRNTRRDEMIKMMRPEPQVQTDQAGENQVQAVQVAQASTEFVEVPQQLADLYSLDDLVTQDNTVLLDGSISLKELVDGLNKIGVNNQELIDILKLIKSAGALKADLVIK